MEPQFKSSFIPKEPAGPSSTRRTSAPTGLLFVAGLVVLVIALAGTGAVFGYSRYVENGIAQKSQELNDMRRDLQPALIEELRRVDARLQSAREILDSHVVISPLFELIEDSTVVNVQFTEFSYAYGPEGEITLLLSGLTPSFEALALQSAEFNRRTEFKNPSFYDLAVDSDGDVVFTMTVDLDSSLVNYQNFVATLPPEVAPLDATRDLDIAAPEGAVEGGTATTSLPTTP